MVILKDVAFFFVCYLNYALIIAPGGCVSFAPSLLLRFILNAMLLIVVDVLCFVFFSIYSLVLVNHFTHKRSECFS